MDFKNLYFSGHATLQMFKRKIQVEEVVEVLKTGKHIKDYPDDRPYPSQLILGFINERPLHVVASTDKNGFTRCGINRQKWKLLHHYHIRTRFKDLEPRF